MIYEATVEHLFKCEIVEVISNIWAEAWAFLAKVLLRFFHVRVTSSLEMMFRIF